MTFLQTCVRWCVAPGQAKTRDSPASVYPCPRPTYAHLQLPEQKGALVPQCPKQYLPKLLLTYMHTISYTLFHEWTSNTLHFLSVITYFWIFIEFLGLPSFADMRAMMCCPRTGQGQCFAKSVFCCFGRNFCWSIMLWFRAEALVQRLRHLTEA